MRVDGVNELLAVLKDRQRAAHLLQGRVLLLRQLSGGAWRRWLEERRFGRAGAVRLRVRVARQVGGGQLAHKADLFVEHIVVFVGLSLCLGCRLLRAVLRLAAAHLRLLPLLLLHVARLERFVVTRRTVPRLQLFQLHTHTRANKQSLSLVESYVQVNVVVLQSKTHI